MASPGLFDRFLSSNPTVALFSIFLAFPIFFLKRLCKHKCGSVPLVKVKNLQQSPMLGGGEKLFKIQNYSYWSNRCVEQDAAP